MFGRLVLVLRWRECQLRVLHATRRRRHSPSSVVLVARHNGRKELDRLPIRDGLGGHYGWPQVGAAVLWCAAPPDQVEHRDDPGDGGEDHGAGIGTRIAQDSQSTWLTRRGSGTAPRHRRCVGDGPARGSGRRWRLRPRRSPPRRTRRTQGAGRPDQNPGGQQAWKQHRTRGAVSSRAIRYRIGTVENRLRALVTICGTCPMLRPCAVQTEVDHQHRLPRQSTTGRRPG